MAEHKAATSFLNLPNELVLSVAEYLPRQSDISHLRRVSKRTYLCLGNYLLLYNIRHYNSSALLWAAAHNHMEIARWLIRLGADLEPEPDEVYRLRYGLRRGYCHARKTPLDVAVEEGHVHMVKMLTTAPLSKAKVSIQGPLTTALLQGRETIARFLINRLTSIDLPITTASETALEITCNGRLPATMQYLLDKGADPSRCSEQLVTLLPSKDPLKYKLEDDAFEIIKLLCSYGAKFSRKIQDLGLQHKDPRVRHCFNKANTQDPLQSCHNSATSGITETSAYNTQDEDDSGSDHHSFNPGSVFGVNAALAHRDLRKVALELNAIPELPQYDTISFPELSNNALKTDNSAEAYWRRFDRLKLCDIEPETSTIEAPTRRTDPFPALGTSEPRVDNTTQRRWDNLENLNRKSGESPARVSAAFHFQQPEPEPFPALGGRTRQTQSTAPDPWRTLSTAFIPHTRTATITSPSDPNLATSSTQNCKLQAPHPQTWTGSRPCFHTARTRQTLSRAHGAISEN
ncbi:hypothetical protein BDV95DRAFT_672000 [Massariosphaeria phaeospora]|uniref:F-box domain-containing protein n=1 Tax=Massariosphaeria phaeospora TaxID=100035 RepID=A0A7C8I6H4_9PLEO|nr:hypothetical protein BDV95DRAFT_672000 [Massariosphaeria phaeospora]